MKQAVFALIASVAAPAAAEVPFLALPLDCRLGETCFVEDYVDAKPGPGQSDYTCGIKSRDGHRGTDIVLSSHQAMEDGVAVLASAPGIVEATRDGMEDRPYTPEIAAEIDGKECGNAVRIRHENGYQTLYCHLKQGSVSVTQGQTVTTGDTLGLVGMSGQSNIPHVHISVLKGGAVVDPFAPDADSCGPREDSLWTTAIPYEPTGFITAGFSDHAPSFDDVRSGKARAARLGQSEAMVLYGYFHDAKRGDVLSFEATGPNGQVFEHSKLLKDVNRAMYQAFGKRAPDGGWTKGDYRGVVTLTRGETLIGWRHADVTID
jgi:hypothetical protein